MEEPLKYYFANNWRVCVNFDKYTIDENGVVRNEKREALRYSKNKAGYQNVGVRDASGKSRNIYIARALASTFIGPPPTKEHTADHEDKIRANDTLNNIRWLCKLGQRDNQTRLDAYKSAFLVDRYGKDEKIIKEWVDYLKKEKNHLGHKYTIGMINQYAQKKQHGFAYKEYPDLPHEVWKGVKGSKNRRGMWQVSNMNRVKYVTKHAENVLEKDHLGLMNGYPTIKFNGKNWYLHVVAFMTFFPDEWANKKPDEMVLHKEDNKMDFRPEMLRLGTGSENAKDARNNGKHDGTLTARMKCASYYKGVLEKEHESQEAAAEYMISIGFDKARSNNISRALNGIKKNGSPKISYDRMWVCI